MLQRSLLYKEIKSEQYSWKSGNREFAGDSEEEQEYRGAVPPVSLVSFTAITQVGKKRWQRERCGDDILTVGNPGNGFHVRRMNYKQRSGGNRDHPPPSQRQCDQKNASRNRACPYVTGQMIRQGIEARDTVIQQVREEVDR